MTTKARQLAELIANSLVDSDEISTGAVTTSKLASTLDFSSKTMVMADNQLSGDKIHGGTVSAFASTGIDDNASATAVTILSDGTVGIGTDVDRGGILNVDGTTKGIVVRTTSSSAMELIHADNGASVGPYLYLNRPSSGPAADDQIGQIVIQGKNSADEVIDYVRLVNQIKSPTDGSEQGRFAINTMTSGTMNSRLNIVNGESVFNDESIDVDFRVESNNNTHMLFVDAGNDRISVGSGSTYSMFNVISSNDNTSDWWTNSVATQYIQNTVGHPVLKMNNNNSNRSAYVVYNGNGSAQGFHIFDRQNEQSRISAYTSSVVINEAGTDVDFRVESDNNINALFVRGSDGNVGIGTNSPGRLLTLFNDDQPVFQITNNTSGSASTNGMIFYQASGSTNHNIDNQGSGSGGDIQFMAAGSNTLKIQANGRVGIGTTSPGAKLTITDEDSGQAMLQVRNFSTSATGGFGNAHSVEFRSATSTTVHGVLIHHHENAIGRRSLDVSDANGIFASFVQGKVGIGTTSPSANLHIVSGTTQEPHVLLENNVSSGGDVGITFADSVENYAYRAGIDDTGNKFTITAKSGAINPIHGVDTDALLIHPSGIIDMPQNPVALYYDVTDTNPTVNATVIGFVSKAALTRGITDSNNKSRFTFSAGGIYAVSYTVAGSTVTASAGDGIRIIIKKDGSTYASSNAYNIASTGTAAGMEYTFKDLLLISVAANDYIELWWDNIGGAVFSATFGNINIWKVA